MLPYAEMFVAQIRYFRYYLTLHHSDSTELDWNTEYVLKFRGKKYNQSRYSSKPIYFLYIKKILTHFLSSSQNDSEVGCFLQARSKDFI